MFIGDLIEMPTVKSLPGYDSKNPLHSSWSRVFSRQKNEAKRGRKSWNITAEYAWDLLNKQNWTCALTGEKFVPAGNYDRMQMSLDRKNNKIGYEIGNVQYVTLFVNRVKNYLSDEEFIQLCRQVASHAK